MGVHDAQFYPAVKKLLGIPQDEPIFVLRAQDAAAAATIVDYEDNYRGACAVKGIHPDGDFIANLEASYDEFDRWASENSDTVKVPD